ncbi:Elongation factor 1-delta 2 [Coccomyxa sp. Obi]|nr:Elongation factor 1-delta 2 [Coccomyxa sp. Obi]
MVSFPALTSADGLKALNDHLLTRSYVVGYQASRDDLAVYSALEKAPSAKEYPHAARWYSHIEALLGQSFPGKGEGVTIEGASTSAAPAKPAAAAPAAPAVPAPAAKAPAAAAEDDDDDDDDDDEDLDLFGELTEEEKKAKEEKDAIIAAAKKRGAEKAKLTKSLIIMDVKPWDDTTDMAALEAEVRAIHKDGLLWGASKLVPVGFGIKKLQITAVIEDSKIESMDAIIEEELVKDGESENIQSIDIASFNKL